MKSCLSQFVEIMQNAGLNDLVIQSFSTYYYQVLEGATGKIFENEIEYVPDGEAFTYLNQIRTRAGLQPKTSSNGDPNLAVPDQEAFRNAIDHERRVELAFEGHRFFDLVRWGTLVEKMSNFYFGANVKEHHVLFAIPQSEIDINPDKILQNLGY